MIEECRRNPIRLARFAEQRKTPPIGGADKVLVKNLN
jgi:hypothetical protein